MFWVTLNRFQALSRHRKWESCGGTDRSSPNVPPLPLLTDGRVAMWMATLRPSLNGKTAPHESRVCGMRMHQLSTPEAVNIATLTGWKLLQDHCKTTAGLALWWRSLLTGCLLTGSPVSWLSLARARASSADVHREAIFGHRRAISKAWRDARIATTVAHLATSTRATVRRILR